MKIYSLLLLPLLSSLLLLSSTVATAEQIIINGAGATFPYPIYTKWFSEFGKLNSTIQFNYQPIGSGGGVKQLLKETVDFAASDTPIKEDEKKSAPWPILHIPTVVGSVVMVYNIPELENSKSKEKLQLDGTCLAAIYLGKISKWNDPLLQKQNPKLVLPNKDILVIRRSDGSGTTEIFTSYLSASDTTWNSSPGSGKSIAWPTGIGAKGNDGITTMVKQSPYSIGYVEYAYAVSNALATASLKSGDNNYTAPSIASMSSAASSIGNIDSKDLQSGDLKKLSLLSQKGGKGVAAYPMSSFTYILLPLPKTPNAKLIALKQFLKWAINDGQSMAAKLDYAPIPKELAQKISEQLK
ncbi:MAG: phosphate ABC transporter substrate-binding protein PstS [Oligoflexia bacterium]|nr:phosphate ABC transporter substrate-binding protein PstS [Oligoflexia bacterium]MBF0364940.1 phosphate ABC transporter substrate-binding protein PstS [Oligoflexia bacterium]